MAAADTHKSLPSCLSALLCSKLTLSPKSKHWLTAQQNFKGKEYLKAGRVPWSRDLRRIVIIRRSWIRILVLDTGWTFFTLICCKICSVCLKRLKKVNKSPRMAYLKKSTWKCCYLWVTSHKSIPSTKTGDRYNLIRQIHLTYLAL